MTTSHQDDLIERFRQLDTCAVSDALDQIGRSGATGAIRSRTSADLIAGRATTVQLALSTSDQPPSRHLCTEAIASAGPNAVIVVAHPRVVDAAGWGGLLSAAAQARGVLGTVIDGPARDIPAAHDLGYPVYSRSVTPRTARGRVVESAWDQAVSIDGIRVRPGDIVVADGSGVAFVSQDVELEVLERAEAIAAAELQMGVAVRSGESIVDVMGKRYETMTRGTQ